MDNWGIKFINENAGDMYWAGWGLGGKDVAKSYPKADAITLVDTLMEEFNDDGIISRLGNESFTGVEVVELDKVITESR